MGSGKSTCLAVPGDPRGAVVIIGANRGIGLELARQLSDRGTQVVATFRGAACEELSSIEGLIAVSGMDVCKGDTLEPLVRACKGGVSMLIVNAGLLAAGSDGKKLADLGEADYKAFVEEFEVNAIGPLRTVVALQKFLSPGAKVVLLGTTLASTAGNEGGLYGYRASKCALHNIGAGLARDLKGQASVAIVHPGFVETGMTAPLGFKAGTNGVVDTAASAEGIIRVIDGLTAENSGSAWDAGTGKTFDW